jgi:hypothetical protein
MGGSQLQVRPIAPDNRVMGYMLALLFMFVVRVVCLCA